MAGKSLMLAIRLLVKGENVEADIKKAESAIDSLDKKVESSNKKQSKSSSDVAKAAKTSAKEISAIGDAAEVSSGKATSAFGKLKESFDSFRGKSKDVKTGIEGIGDASVKTGTNATSGFAAFGGKLAEIGKSLAAGAIVAGIVAIGAAVTNLVKGALDEYKKLNQTTMSVTNVFGESGQKIQAFAQEAVTTLGLTRAEYQGMATDIGLALKGINVPMDELANRSQDIIRVSRDLSTVWGMDTSEAAKKLTDEIKNGNDGIGAFNFNMSDAAVKAYAAANGLSGLSDEQVRLRMAVDEGAGSLGAWNSQANTGARRQAEMNAKWSEAKAELGERLQPALLTLMDAFEDMMPIIQGVILVIAQLAQWFANVIEWIAKATNAIGGFLSKAGEIAGSVLGFITGRSLSAEYSLDHTGAVTYGAHPREDGTRPVASAINQLRPTFNFAISIDGAQLQSRITSTVNSLMAYDGARLSAGSWY